MADAFSFFPQMPSLPQGVTVPPQTMEQLQKDYLQELTHLWQNGLAQPKDLTDRRFKADAWKNNPMANMAAALYLLNTRTLKIGRAHV